MIIQLLQAYVLSVFFLIVIMAVLTIFFVIFAIFNKEEEQDINDDCFFHSFK